MNKVIYILIISLSITSCSKECKDGCPEWEECVTVGTGMFWYEWDCRSVLNKYTKEYTGQENIIYDGDQDTSITRKISLNGADVSPSNNMRLWMDYGNETNDKFLYVVFTETGKFEIPRQSIYCPVIHPLINNVVYTNVFYEGTGNMTNSGNEYQITLDYTYEFFGQSITASFTGY